MRSLALAVAALALVVSHPAAQNRLAVDAALFHDLHWRSLGPSRGGPTTLVVGSPVDPAVFYLGTPGGGLWKTTDAGHLWSSTAPFTSVGALAIAPSNANIIYAGTGTGAGAVEVTTGDGVYKSIDAGASWTHLGLDDTSAIGAIAVDSRDPDRVFVAAMGHPFKANAARGIYRSLDGGRTFHQVLDRGPTIGANSVAIDPDNPSVILAALRGTGTSASGPELLPGPGTSLVKSTDGGDTWREITRGLPSYASDDLAELRVALGMSHRVYLAASAKTRAGFYRSDDDGESWTLASDGAPFNDGSRAWPSIATGPQPDVVYAAGQGVWRSTDGGHSFAPWAGTPTGRVYAGVWVDRANAGRVALASDGGAFVTVNGGTSWSNSDGQPTAWTEHVATDTAFPYNACGAVRGLGAICVPTEVDPQYAAGWEIVGPSDTGDVAPDPTDANVIYSGDLTRFDRRTRGGQNVLPIDAVPDASTFPGPLLFANTILESRTLYFATTRLWQSTTSAATWTALAPLVAPAASSAAPAPPRVVTSVGSSLVDGRLLWVGTSDGTLQITKDAGTTWTIVTPPDVKPGSTISGVEGSHFDPATAYVSVTSERLDEKLPHVYRTRDGGSTWTAIVNGLSAAGLTFAVREDLFRRGLLFAATSHGVYLSFDDGDLWQPFRQSLPDVEVRDLTIKDADIVAATAGRGFWLLDDVAPLRQATADLARAPAFLFRPTPATRLAATGAPATTRELGAGHAAIDYLVGPGVTGPIRLEIADAVTGEIVRRYTSDATRAADRLNTTPGLHRLDWNLRYAPLGDDLLAAPGVRVMPGTYQVRLSDGSRVLRQAISVRMDPRIHEAPPDLQAQFDLSRRAQAALAELDRARSSEAATIEASTLARARLVDVIDALERSDARPSAATEAEANLAFEAVAPGSVSPAGAVQNQNPARGTELPRPPAVR